MVTTAKRLFFFQGREAATLYVGAAAACVVGVAAMMMAAEATTVALALLHVAILTGVALAWQRADSAGQAAQQASSDLAQLAGRLGRLEQKLRAPEANPALRSTMAEVTGTVGLLGGVVRELARNVAAQHRDVATLKDTVTGGARGDAEETPAGASDPDPAGARERPEPSLLPSPAPALQDIGRVRLVMQAFEADRIELHLQPVVALPQRKVRFYEALARLRLLDGTLLGPTEFLPVLERFGRAPDFDRRMIGRAVAVARHLVARGSEAIVGVNLTARSIREPGFLHSLARITEAAPDVVGKLVLEFPQDAWRALDRDQKEALAILRDQGVPLSLDRAVDLAFDARTFADLGVRFLKLPAEMMLAAAEEDERRGGGYDIGVRDFASILRREGIRLVAERVEREDMVPALVDLGVPLAQGFVFAAPRAIRAEVLDQAPQKTAFSSDRREPGLRQVG
jgi:cyclic-di-GMP phosphodiesterase TipF (flagellum assembly factor)